MNTFTPVAQTKEFTNFIIGKMWINKTGTSSISINRNLPRDLVIKANDSLTIYPNTKRTSINPQTNEVYNDADFTVSVLLPHAQAVELQKEAEAKANARRTA